jgi:heat shock protein HslJ
LFAISKRKPISDSDITLTFEDGQVSGSAGCNRFFGPYQVDDESITFQDLAITEMACLSPEGVMEQENLIMEFLWDAQRFQLEADRLMIFRSDGEALTFDRQ